MVANHLHMYGCAEGEKKIRKQYMDPLLSLCTHILTGAGGSDLNIRRTMLCVCVLLFYVYPL